MSSFTNGSISWVLPLINPKLKQGPLPCAAFLCWNLWKARNEFYFEHRDSLLIQVIHRAEQAFSEYMDCVFPSGSGASNESSYSSLLAKWNPPPLGLVKLNTDAALASEHSWWSRVHFEV
ncbi:hypothetical protein NE237_023337 [Protea cynaroides]|uniref:Uncharacterized protein n=1 Tax=Protea cynaroides TaxID=273540 RepID=A0A9Q0HER2_9MAGN|nr:hypothetical protein NE237_023337 [Protea cynaroides]